MNKAKLLLDAIIDLRTNQKIITALDIPDLTKPVYNSMLKTIEHLMEAILSNDGNLGSIKTQGKLFFYSLTSANHSKHVVLNGRKITNNRFSLFNDVLGICEILEKGNNIYHDGLINTWSSMAFTKSVFPLVSSIYNDVIMEVKEKEMGSNKQISDLCASARRDAVRVFIRRHITQYQHELSDISAKYDILNHSSYTTEDQKQELIAYREHIPYLSATIDILEYMALFSIDCQQTFIEFIYPFTSNKSITISFWDSKIENEEFFNWVTDKLAPSNPPGITSISLPLHINSKSITTGLLKLENDLIKLNGENNTWTPSTIEKTKNSISVLTEITTSGVKCRCHDDCLVVSYEYVARESGCGRLINGKSLQTVKKSVRRIALPLGYSCDIETSVFSILRYLAIDLDKSIIPNITIVSDYIENKSDIRERLASEVFRFDVENRIAQWARIGMIKTAMTSIGFGGKLICTSDAKGKPYQAIGEAFNIQTFSYNKEACDNFLESEYVKQFYAEFQLIKDLICSKYPSDSDIVGGYPFSKTKDTEFLAHIYQGFESKILREILARIYDHDGENGYPFNYAKSVLPLHDGLFTNWQLDPFMLSKAIITVLGNAHPEYLPKFESTYIFDKNILELINAEEADNVIKHKRLIAEQEHIARTYVPLAFG